MHLTREGDYAIRVLVDLAGRAPGEVVRTEDLTVTTGVPRAYLAKIVQALARAHLVLTRQGPGGGVSLGDDPARISLRRMVEAIEGPIHLNRCLLRAGECPRDGFCAVHPVWARIQAVLIRELEAVRLEDLTAKDDRHHTPVTAPRRGLHEQSGSSAGLASATIPVRRMRKGGQSPPSSVEGDDAMTRRRDGVSE
jgi:Rrf2 family transcriptional regulator, iron-sulfur cluster assembly transcription factor